MMKKALQIVLIVLAAAAKGTRANDEDEVLEAMIMRRGPPTNNAGGSVRGAVQESLTGCWYQFSQAGYCVTKIEDPTDATSDKVKFMPCDDTSPAQMWKFDKVDPNPNYMYGGLLFNMHGGCLAIRGNVVAGKNLKVVACNRNNAKLHWLSDGDSLLPRDYRTFCVSPATKPIERRDRVILRACSLTDSLDY
jgi:hypothetical protein